MRKGCKRNSCSSPEWVPLAAAFAAGVVFAIIFSGGIPFVLLVSVAVLAAALFLM